MLRIPLWRLARLASEDRGVGSHLGYFPPDSAAAEIYHGSLQIDIGPIEIADPRESREGLQECFHHHLLGDVRVAEDDVSETAKRCVVRVEEPGKQGVSFEISLASHSDL
jgi:hypothetical protein